MVLHYQQKAEVISSEQLTEDIFRLTLHASEIAGAARPGQFVMLRITEVGDDPLLRRPFSIYQAASNGTLQILYKVVGKVTRLMTFLRPGKWIDLIGPLGNGFALEQTKNLCLIGGGIGAAPLFFLSTWLMSRHPSAALTVLLGARTRLELRAVAEGFEELGIPVITATDDGSAGHHGYIIDIIEQSLNNARPWHIYSCGPYPMLRAISKLCHRRAWPCQVSLETMMACGISACLGCAVPKAGLNGYLHACKDGPVFDAAKLAWF